MNKEINTICCGKEMYYEDNPQSLIPQFDESESWICLECGCFVTISKGQLDEEEIQELQEKMRRQDNIDR